MSSVASRLWPPSSLVACVCCTPTLKHSPKASLIWQLRAKYSCTCWTPEVHVEPWWLPVAYVGPAWSSVAPRIALCRWSGHGPWVMRETGCRKWAGWWDWFLQKLGTANYSERYWAGSKGYRTDSTTLFPGTFRCLSWFSECRLTQIAHLLVPLCFSQTRSSSSLWLMWQRARL